MCFHITPNLFLTYIRRTFQWQEKMKTMDGNNAAAWVSYPFTDLAAIYPITPSSPMAEVTDQWSAKDKKKFIRTACSGC